MISDGHEFNPADAAAKAKAAGKRRLSALKAAQDREARQIAGHQARLKAEAAARREAKA